MLINRNSVTAAQLTAIFKHQPESLVLNKTNFAKLQLGWLLNRLPQLKCLSLQRCNWSGVSALNTYSCPVLTTLDLSYVSGM